MADNKTTQSKLKFAGCLKQVPQGLAIGSISIAWNGGEVLVQAFRVVPFVVGVERARVVGLHPFEHVLLVIGVV